MVANEQEVSEVSDAVLADRLRAARDRVKVGEEARDERARLIEEAGRRNWPRAWIAELAGVTPQAVSKRIVQSRQRRDTDTTE